MSLTLPPLYTRRRCSDHPNNWLAHLGARRHGDGPDGFAGMDRLVWLACVARRVHCSGRARTFCFLWTFRDFS